MKANIFYKILPVHSKIRIHFFSKPRKGWEKAFKEMSINGDDQLIFGDIFEDDTFDEWK